MRQPVSQVTRALEASNRGDAGARERLHELVYDELRRIAAGQRRKHGRDATMQSTEIVHEIYAKLHEHGGEFESRGHFLAFCSTAMRHLIVDAARRRLAQKRGAGERDATFEEWLVPSQDRAEDVVAVSQALARLREIDERLVRLVECRFFLGLTEQETAEALDCSRRTVQRDWLRARAWLQTTIDEEH